MARSDKHSCLLKEKLEGVAWFRRDHAVDALPGTLIARTARGDERALKSDGKRNVSTFGCIKSERLNWDQFNFLYG